MRNRTEAVALGLVALTVIGSGTAIASQRAEDAERGRYLVEVLGCHDCHTPLVMTETGPQRDMSRMLSGHPESLAMPIAPKLPDGPWGAVASHTFTAWNGPWGTSFTANLTPDEETGLGKWTYENFRDTIRTGRHLGRGREVLPPMPIPAYSQLSDADLESVYKYLRTVPAVRNRVPEPRPPAPAPAASGGGSTSSGSGPEGAMEAPAVP